MTKAFLLVTLLTFQTSASDLCPRGSTDKTCITNIGAVFTYDESNTLMGPGWRAPNGLLWSNFVFEKDGTLNYMSQYDALDYCKSVSAHLPTKQEYETFAAYLGYGSPIGYADQVFLDLSSADWSWTSTTVPGHDDWAFVYFTNWGNFDSEYHRISPIGSVRCISNK